MGPASGSAVGDADRNHQSGLAAATYQSVRYREGGLGPQGVLDTRVTRRNFSLAAERAALIQFAQGCGNQLVRDVQRFPSTPDITG